MPRNISTAMLQQIENRHMWPALFAVIPWAGGTQYAWSGVGSFAAPWGSPAPWHEYDLAQTSGTVVKDAIHSDDMTATNITWGAVAGLGAGAATFDGSTSSISGPDSDSSMEFTGSTPFSVALWFCQTAQSALQPLIGNMELLPPNAGWEIALVNNTIQFQMVSNYALGDYLAVTTAGAVTTGVPYFLAMTYDGSGHASGVSIYLNGVALPLTILQDTLTGSAATTGSSGTGVNSVQIGSRLGGYVSTGGAVAGIPAVPAGQTLTWSYPSSGTAGISNTEVVNDGVTTTVADVSFNVATATTLAGGHVQTLAFNPGTSTNPGGYEGIAFGSFLLPALPSDAVINNIIPVMTLEGSGGDGYGIAVAGPGAYPWQIGPGNFPDLCGYVIPNGDFALTATFADGGLAAVSPSTYSGGATTSVVTDPTFLMGFRIGTQGGASLQSITCTFVGLAIYYSTTSYFFNGAMSYVKVYGATSEVLF